MQSNTVAFLPQERTDDGAYLAIGIWENLTRQLRTIHNFSIGQQLISVHLAQDFLDFTCGKHASFNRAVDETSPSVCPIPISKHDSTL